jgi:unsaturated chondroitin disaccharide hydrolase
MLKIAYDLTPAKLCAGIGRLWELSAIKIRSIEVSSPPSKGAPVFTVGGQYTSRGWTEWTQGFQFGSAILQFDAAGDREFLELGRRRTVERMALHITHTGVHDHGFNIVSTYGNLLRLMNEGAIEPNPWERAYYELALKCSGAVQARRWTGTREGLGFIYSFNGPHSLFVDTLRTLRALALAHQLGHTLMDENDRRISLLERVVKHAHATAAYSVYYGNGRDAYDRRGRVAHESVFNVNDGNYRCPNSQQGYSAFTTWTRGLAWAMCGFAELLEFLSILPDEELELLGGRDAVCGPMLRAAQATCDFYVANVPTDGVPYWDTGAPDLAPEDWDRPSDPFNGREPVDSSAAAIAAQGLLRLGHHLQGRAAAGEAEKYWQAGLTVLSTLLGDPYLSSDPGHQGLILHSIYHRPNGWDFVPPGRKIPCGESSMWGDYHARELALYVQRIARRQPYLGFFVPQKQPPGHEDTGMKTIGSETEL